MGFSLRAVFDYLDRTKKEATAKAFRRNKFNTKDRKGMYLGNASIKTEYDFPEVSAEKLSLIKAQIRAEASKEKKKQGLYVLLAAIAILIIYRCLVYIETPLLRFINSQISILQS